MILASVRIDHTTFKRHLNIDVQRVCFSELYHQYYCLLVGLPLLSIYHRSRSLVSTRCILRQCVCRATALYEGTKLPPRRTKPAPREW